MPIVSTARLREGAFTLPELPLCYMNDYSEIGLQVSSYEEALVVLKSSAYEVHEKTASADLVVGKAADIPNIVRLLKDRGIDCQVSDVAVALYQG